MSIDKSNYGTTLSEKEAFEIIIEGLRNACEAFIVLAEITHDVGWLNRGRDLAANVDVITKLYNASYGGRADK